MSSLRIKRVPASLGLVACCLISHAAAVIGQQTSSSSTATVVALLRSGDATKALAETSRLLRQQPGDCRVWSLQAVAQQTLGEPTPALKSFQHALLLCPDYLPALEGAAQMEYAAHAPRAADDLRRIIAQRPKDPVSHAMLAGTLASQGECASALVDFRVAQPLFASQPGLLGDYGVCLMQTEHWADAITVFTQLGAEQPSDRATYDLAYARWKAGQPQDALATLHPLLQGGSDEDALVLASNIAEDSGDTVQSVTLLRQAILLQPKNIENYLAFARLAAAHKSYQVGIDMVDAGLGVLPDAAPLYVARGVLLVQLSKTPAAVADFDHAHQLDPKLSAAMDAIGVLQEQQHDDSASLVLFRKQAALHPDDALLQFLLAEALSEHSDGNVVEAIAAAQKASALEPTYRPALDLLATLYLREGKLAPAVQEAEKALALDANDSQALFTEIRAKRRLGDTVGIAALSERLARAQSANQAQAGNAGRYRLTDR
jgi:tetratricopeptide (TPR) repeat protein